MEQLRHELSVEGMTEIEAVVAEVGDGIQRLEQWYVGWQAVKQSKEAELGEIREKNAKMLELVHLAEEEKIQLESILQEEVRCREKMSQRIEKDRSALDVLLQEEENLSDAAQACEANRDSCQKDQEVRQQILKDALRIYEDARSRSVTLQMEKKAEITALMEELSELDHSFTETKAEVENKRQQAIQLHEQAEQLTNEWSVQESFIKKGKEEIVEKEKLLELAKERKRNVQVQVDTVHAEKSNFLEEKTTLVDRVRSVQEELSRVEKENSAAEAAIRLNKDLNNVEMTVKESTWTSCNKKSEELKIRIGNLEAGIGLLQSSIEGLKHESVTALAMKNEEAELLALQREKELLRKEIIKKETVRISLLAAGETAQRTHNERLTKLQDNLRACDLETEDKRRKKAALQQALEHKTQRLKELQARLDEAQKPKVLPKPKESVVVAPRPAARKQARAPSFFKSSQQDQKQSKPGQGSSQAPEKPSQATPQFVRPEKRSDFVRSAYNEAKRVQREPSVASTESEYIDLPNFD